MAEVELSHYLDYAATSALRPPEVAEAVATYLREIGATPGRGSYGRSLEAGRIALRCRRVLASLLGLPGDPGRIAFMFNATHGLNTALWGVLRRDDVVVVSAYDHNSVLRPVERLARERGVRVRMLTGDRDGGVDLTQAARALDGARLLVVNAASNVLGTCMPLRTLARLAHDAGALVLVDAAQAAGHLPCSLEADGADLVAFTGHKGLLGPQGTGGLWVREGVDIAPFMTGGTGGDSLLREMPPIMPDHLEAGTLNAPGIAGLLAACTFLEKTTVNAVRQEEMRLKTRLWEGLTSIAGVDVLSPRAPDGVPLVTIRCDDLDPPTLADCLDREWGVMTRAGLHCAPEVHRILGTAASGAVRFSLGWASRDEDVDAALHAVDALVRRALVVV